MKPVIFAILDGWGIAKHKQGNAIAQAKTPIIDEIEKFYPATSLQASGIAAGLPWKEPGNSEVGHLNLGAGRIVYQSLPRIVLAIKDKSFFKNPALLQASKHAEKNNSCLHLMGLVSSGSVHSYIDHLYGLIEFAKKENIEKVRLHIFTDGEDSPSKEAAEFLRDVEKKLNELKDGKIATVIGRIYAMDRNKNWDRTETTYNCLTRGIGLRHSDLFQALQEFYKQGLTDTFIKPIVISDRIRDNDSVIFFNFRKDRARQLTKAFVMPNFKEFPRKPLKNLCFVTMTQYEEGLPVKIAFPPIEIRNHLTEVLSKAGKKILKIAETEKYAHVTYFFNGGKEEVYPGEKRILVPSATMPHYDKYPEMAALEITNKILDTINENESNLIVVNYANPDMVAHTGNFQATIKAVEFIDKQLKTLLGLVLEKKCYLLISSDHGNAEEMIHPRTGEPNPEHSANPVPFYLVNDEYKKKPGSRSPSPSESPQGILSDVAPTILELMQIPQPPEMTGQSLLGILK